MNLELRCESIRRELNSHFAQVPEEFHQVGHAYDYAKQIATATRKALSSPLQRKLWIQELRLTHCFFILPTEMFASSIKCFFATDDWEPENWDDGVGDLGEGLVYLSFFDNGLITHPLVHVRLCGNKVPAQRAPRARGITHVEVREDFFDYVTEWIEGGPLKLKINDPRVAHFVDCNPNFLDILGDRDFRIIGRISDQDSRCVTDDVKIFDDLQMICPPPDECRHLYRMSKFGGGADSAVFAFVFHNPVASRYRVVLRLFAQLLLSSFSFLERVELRRRGTKYELSHDAAKMGFHDMRNLLGTLSNEIDSALAAHHDEDSNVLEAALAAASETHYEAVRLLDKLEVNSSSSVDSSDRQSTLRSLQQLWLSIFPPGPYQDIHLETEQESILFDLPGSPESLGRALSNFFDHKTPISEMLTGPSDDAQISLSLDLSASFLRVECCFAPLLPPHVEEALRSVSVDRRLPSTKNQGGRGLLSAISVIRNDFSGTIHFGNNPDLGFRWEVMIPISIVRQYRLFPEVF